MRGIAKRFGAVHALVDVDLEIAKGEVHALVGENGAGKSTLMKVLSGAHAPDAGAMTLAGRAFTPRHPLDALQRGVAMIYQELNLADDLTVGQNLVLGREKHRFGLVQRDDERIERALEILPELSRDARVGDLGPGAKQLVEIGRALTIDATIVVLDEPTSSLSAVEAAQLRNVLDRLRESGVAIVYITHYLEEILDFADRYTVLRDGQTVGSGVMADATIDSLVHAMVGRSLDTIFPEHARSPGDALLEMTLHEHTTTLRRGEVLGISGLVGAGRTELARAIYGLDPVRNGTIKVGGVELAASIRGRIAQGLGLVSEDRKAEGLALDRTIAENLTLSNMESFSKRGVLDLATRADKARHWLHQLRVKHRDTAQRVGELSGGNQQKIAIARLLHQDADLIILDEPTRGIDIASKVEVYEWIHALASQNKAVLMISSHLPELLGVCDRIAVMHRGQLGTPRAVHEWTEESLLDEATRGVHA